MKPYAIFNPAAGPGDAEPVRRSLTEHFGPDLQIYETTGDDDIKAIVTQALADGYDCIVAAGGDGTVSFVGDALAERDVPLGIIPSGSGNALARDLGIPQEVDAACTLIAGPHGDRYLDTLKVKDRHCLLRIGVGFDATVLQETTRDEKTKMGALAYVVRGVQTVKELSPYPIHLEVDGYSHDLDAVQLTLANGSSWGPPGLGLDWGEDVQPDDGCINVYALRGQTTADFARLAWNVVRHRAQDSEEIQALRAYESITVETPGSTHEVHGDGEPIGHTPFTVRIVPGAVRVIVPQ
jgi:YegS/Rv2252/BmrU family lipid kinase